MVRYSKMAQLVNEIQEKIKSNEERETLYLQLVRVFALTSKSNVSTMLLVFTEAFVATVDEINSDKELPLGLKNLVNTWIFGTQDVQRKN